MKFENAAKGMKWVLIGEFGKIFFTIVVGGIASYYEMSNDIDVFMSLVVNVIFSAITLIGLNLARRDEKEFKNAFYLRLSFIIIEGIFSVLLIMLSVWGTGTFKLIITFFDAVTTMAIYKGIIDLYNRKGISPKLAKVSRGVYLGCVITTIVSLLLSDVLPYFTSDEYDLLVAYIMLMTNLLFAIISYTLYLVTIGKARKKFLLEKQEG